jgi:hypothetical protein
MRGAADLLDVGHARGRLENRMNEDRTFDLGLGLELGQQLVDIVDVPRTLDLRHHDHIKLVTDLGNELGQIVEHPRRVETVYTGPQLRTAEIGLFCDLNQSAPGGDLIFDGNRIFKVAQQHIDLLGDVGDFGGHFRVAGIEKMQHPRRFERNLSKRHRRTDGQRLEELFGATHGLSFIDGASQRW